MFKVLFQKLKEKYYQSRFLHRLTSELFLLIGFPNNRWTSFLAMGIILILAYYVAFVGLFNRDLTDTFFIYLIILFVGSISLLLNRIISEFLEYYWFSENLVFIFENFECKYQNTKFHQEATINRFDLIINHYIQTKNSVILDSYSEEFLVEVIECILSNPKFSISQNIKNKLLATKYILKMDDKI